MQKFSQPDSFFPDPVEDGRSYHPQTAATTDKKPKKKKNSKNKLKK